MREKQQGPFFSWIIPFQRRAFGYCSYHFNPNGPLDEIGETVGCYWFSTTLVSVTDGSQISFHLLYKYHAVDD